MGRIDWRTHWRTRWRTWRGVLRSLGIYYGNRSQRAAMDRLYGQFVRAGDLVFDVGAHVGDRVGSFRRLGARVVAVEPQPPLVTTLKLLYGLNRNVIIEPSAIGREIGSVALKLNIDNPTISTASEAFVRAADGAPGWQNQAWTETIEVPLTTLDVLIERHGRPAFIKIDVEGFEAEALAALSFEFTTIQRDVALGCLIRCTALGFRRYKAALGESQSFVEERWQTVDEIARWLKELPVEANSGDIYAAID
jgi:FkbM family methyltransferase